MKISLFNRHVTVLDYAYLDDHRGLVGDSLWVNVTFIGKTDREGIVYDFSLAKKKVKSIIDKEVDHRLVVPKGLVERSEGYVKFSYEYGLEKKVLSYSSPDQGVCEIDSFCVTKQSLQSYLEKIIMPEMPENISAVLIELEDEIFSDRPLYHYTHGLKDHYGNCQRLYHGHKNTIEVSVNGKFSSDLENFLSYEVFKGSIHFCYYENVVNKADIEKRLGNSRPTGIFPELGKIHIKYRGSQGEFEGILPAEDVYLMPIESTVENISIHFCQLLKQKIGLQNKVSVRAYEGIGKGALTTL